MPKPKYGDLVPRNGEETKPVTFFDSADWRVTGTTGAFHPVAVQVRNRIASTSPVCVDEIGDEKKVRKYFDSGDFMPIGSSNSCACALEVGDKHPVYQTSILLKPCRRALLPSISTR